MKNHLASWCRLLLPIFALALVGCGPQPETGTAEQPLSYWPDLIVGSIYRSTSSGYQADVCNTVNDLGGYAATVQVKWSTNLGQQYSSFYSMGFYNYSCVTVTAPGGCTGWGNGTCTDSVTMTVMADSNYQISELNESNNSLTKSFSSDSTPPTVSIATPTAGSTVAGSVSVTANASDNVGVTEVDFYAGGAYLGSDYTPPFSATWNTLSLANGTYTITAWAYDAAGNYASAAPVSVQVYNVPDTTPPAVAVTSPADGATVSGSVGLSASASDNVAVTRVEFYVNGTLVGSDTTAPYSATWATGSSANGTYSLTAKAYDAAGNNTVSAPVSVQLYNAPDTTPPYVNITSPAVGATVSGNVTFSATATDNVGVVRVDFYADGTLVGSDTTAPYSVTWAAGSVPNGAHQIWATAWDAASNSSVNTFWVTVANLPAASYDSTLRAPRCAAVGPGCTTGTLVNGRSLLGPEPNASNTLAGSCVDGTYGGYHSDESVDAVKIATNDGSNLRAGAAATVSVTVWAWSGYTSDHLDIYYAPDANNPVWTPLATNLTPAGAGTQTLTVPVTLSAGSLQAVRAAFRYGGSASPCTTGGYDDRDDLAFAVGP